MHAEVRDKRGEYGLIHDLRKNHLGARVLCFGHRAILVFNPAVLTAERTFGGGLSAAALPAQIVSLDVRRASFV